MRVLALIIVTAIAASLAHAAGSSAPNDTARSDAPPSDAATPVLCSATLNAYCPPLSTCCPSAGGYSCLLSGSSHVPQGPCCADDGGASGCAAGYVCTDARSSDDDLTSGPHCRRDDGAAPIIDSRGKPVDTDFEVTKRYRTCPAFAREDIAAPHGLSVSAGQLAYFTNRGPLASPSHRHIKTAVLGIHGSGRDAGSYLCSLIPALVPADASSSRTTAAGRRRRPLELEQDNLLNNAGEAANDILIIAPWFLAPADGTPPTDSSLPFLTWVDEAAVSHSFRYGAESIPVPLRNEDERERPGATVSSFRAMDALLEALCNRDQYPELERIVVVGHSAGGQFVQRWGMSSDSACFGDASDGVGGGEPLPSLRLVAANPRSYAYLDDRRYLPIEGTVAVAASATQETTNRRHASSGMLSPFDNLEFRRPNGAELENCQAYNRYCWGLEPNPDLPVPYVTDHVDRLLPTPDVDPAEDEGSGDAAAVVFARYASRDVVYLSGARDTLPLGDQLCPETGDGYQGPTRRERSERFYAALQARGVELTRTCRGWTPRALSREGAGSVREEGAGISRHATEFCARQEAAGDGEGRVHTRLVVKDVGHDHALIFQSSEAYEGMFD